jgi:hypothetical protein
MKNEVKNTRARSKTHIHPEDERILRRNGVMKEIGLSLLWN